MRILFSSNAWWAHTGYSVPVANLIPRFQAMGHEIGNFAWFGLQGSSLEMGDVRMYPALPDQSELSSFGSNCIGAHVHHFQADVVISVHDIWVLPEDYAARIKSKRPECRWVMWMPVDTSPAAPRVVERARTTDVAAVYSQWGANLLDEAGVEQTMYLPLGVDTEVFTPRDRQAARRALGWPQKGFIAAMVAANSSAPSRKAYPEQMTAFARFAESNPAARLYIHCDWTRAHGGFSLPAIAERLGIRDKVLFVDRYAYAMGLPADYLALVYSAADVLLAASRTEGFGLPIVEAQACGCPVITTGFASMSELTWNGVCVPPVQLAWTPLQSWASVPSVEGIWQALRVVSRWSDTFRASAARVGMHRVQEDYTWDSTVERFWAPLLSALESEM